MSDNAQGGDDTLRGGNDFAFNFLYGDAYAMSDNARGGNDTLTGGVLVFNYLYGDAYTMSDNAQGGDDTLTFGKRRWLRRTTNGMAMPTPWPTTPAAATTR